jgi:hypothetical protein
LALQDLLGMRFGAQLTVHVEKFQEHPVRCVQLRVSPAAKHDRCDRGRGGHGMLNVSSRWGHIGRQRPGQKDSASLTALLRGGNSMARTSRPCQMNCSDNCLPTLGPKRVKLQKENPHVSNRHYSAPIPGPLRCPVSIVPFVMWKTPGKRPS